MQTDDASILGKLAAAAQLGVVATRFRNRWELTWGKPPDTYTVLIASDATLGDQLEIASSAARLSRGETAR